MIYLDNENIVIPNLLGIDSSNYRIVLKNNVTNEEFSLDVSNLSDNELYYTFNIDSSRMASNEYTMHLYDDASVFLGEYLLQKGINKMQKQSFDHDTEYVVFEG